MRKSRGYGAYLIHWQASILRDSIICSELRAPVDGLGLRSPNRPWNNQAYVQASSTRTQHHNTLFSLEVERLDLPVDGRVELGGVDLGFALRELYILPVPSTT